ncbi:flagellar basal body P-ring formation chaperone FlgA [Piscinibacter sakaiensis]|uniref:flagellar basal body P-ring formation chaperone FlgA n=1 Tax=Piscinibacter sakaiensis TaxID=1547922 RepID=UPI003AAD29A2
MKTQTHRALDHSPRSGLRGLRLRDARRVAIAAALLGGLTAAASAATVSPLVIGDPGAGAAAGGAAAAPNALPAELEQSLQMQLEKLALNSSQQAVAGVNRVEIEVGRLDPRLKLAPCERVEPYLPTATRLWGKARIGLRCTQGPTPWNVYLPITVKVFGPAWVAAGSLAQGAVIGADDLIQGEIDLAEEASPIIADPDQATGRVLLRRIQAGQAVRAVDLRPRQWFAAGDVVKVVANGPGFSISAKGEALSHGIEGRAVRVRTDAGKIISGYAAGERRVEVRP